MMRLIDLNAYFVRYETRIETYERVTGEPVGWRVGDPTETVTGPKHYRHHVGTLAEAQGIVFRCPACPHAHDVEATFAGRGAADDQGSHDEHGMPSRWAVSGASLDDVTLTPSVDCTKGNSFCRFHGFVTNGDAA